MTATDESIAVLSRALDQAGDVLAAVHADQLAQPTPCGDWNVAQLIGHLVNAPVRFLEMARGSDPDWSAGPQPVTSNWVADFRSNADDLIHHWHQAGDAADPGQVDWQTAEIAVHTWDVARSTGQSTALLPEVAERGSGVHVRDADAGEPGFGVRIGGAGGRRHPRLRPSGGVRGTCRRSCLS